MAVVPETFGSLAQELFDRMSMLDKSAVPFDFVVDQFLNIAIKNTERGRRASKETLQVKAAQGLQKCPDSGKNFFCSGKTKHS